MLVFGLLSLSKQQYVTLMEINDTDKKKLNIIVRKGVRIDIEFYRKQHTRNTSKY